MGANPKHWLEMPSLLGIEPVPLSKVWIQSSLLKPSAHGMGPKQSAGSWIPPPSPRNYAHHSVEYQYELILMLMQAYIKCNTLFLILTKFTQNPLNFNFHPKSKTTQ